MADFTNRQKEIIVTSIDLIAENGIQGLTIKNIARKVGVSEPAIYRHFDSKIDILLGILSYFRDGTISVLEGISSSQLSSTQQLESIFLDHFKRFTHSPALASVIFSEEIFQNDKRLSEEVLSIMRFSQGKILTIIEEGQNNSEIREDIPKQQLSLIIMGALRIIITRWRLAEFQFDLEEEGTILWNSLKTLIQKEK